MKRITSILLSLMLLFSFVGCSKTEEVASIKDGTYTTTTKGHNGDIELEVVISSGKIETINILNHAETPGIADSALEKIPQQIIDNQSIGVDTISGCTVSSNAIINGVKAALEQAGADIEAFSKKVEKTVTKEEDQEYTTDVVIIGAGGAGLSSAVSALQNDASVIVIEKMPVTGGNTVRSAGYYNAVDPKRQEALGIEDSIDLHIQQTYEGGDKVGNLELITTFANNAYPTLEWLEDLGVEFQDTITTCVGAIHPRTHTPVVPLGSSYIETYEKHIAQYDNAQIMLETTATQLIYDEESNTVTGVIATGPTGNTITLHANKGVIIATGGFSANVEMREEYNTLWPNLGESLPTTNHAGATGDGITLAKEIGANLIDMEYIQLFPLTNPENGSTKGILNGDTANLIYVNKEGTRFTDEGGRRDDICKDILSQTDSVTYTICDGQVYPTGEEVNLDGIKINDMVENGEIIKANSITELAQAIGCDPDTLQKTIDDYNAVVNGEKEDEFGRTLFNNPITTAPFYARVQAPAVHHTMGGIQINTDAQVLNTDGEIINNLYAAGEVTGGIHGSNRLGGNAIPDTAIFGKIAGQNAANN
ncbi:MAG: flavocytochrome c [Erysipelotrichaceae bacterium]|nr:flavocytochrome c [Erysipelotrichaceae bacterium]MDY5253017.1 flavocytochrome c [Erysipelotrichaceae bacterium]